jgi:hypothetical protein
MADDFHQMVGLACDNALAEAFIAQSADNCFFYLERKLKSSIE